MPTYEYQCLKCKKKFDQLQKITAGALKKCIHCGGKAERLISAGTGFIFKGSGFYSTDYKKIAPSDPGAAPAKGARLPPAGQAGTGRDKQGQGSSPVDGKTESKKEKKDEK